MEKRSSTKSIKESFFLPAAGARTNDGGPLVGQGTAGRYISSTVFSSTSGYYLAFENGRSIVLTDSHKATANSVRCVR